MSSTMINLTDLAIGYPGRRGQAKVVASGISADIGGGELTCLLGANGAGKSTLLRTLAAFQPKLAGSIRIGGRDYEQLADFLKKVDDLSKMTDTRFCFTISTDLENLPERMFAYCEKIN